MALATQGWSFGELAAICVVSGPGSFTGVRVGLATAKGLCQAADIPLVLLSRLAVLAHKAPWAHGAAVHAVLDAGRSEFFYGRFAPGEPPAEALLDREALLSACVGGQVVACEDAVLQKLPELHIQLTPALTALDALPLVVSRVERQSFDDLASSDANYLRRTELEVLETLRRRALAQ